MTGGQLLVLIVGAVLTALGSVLGGLILFYVKRALSASLDAASSNAGAQHAAEMTRLDVVSVQGKLHELDQDMRQLKDKSTDLAFRARTEARLRNIEQFMEHIEKRALHATAVGSDQVPG